MSKQTPSRDFHFEFEHHWGGTPSEVQQLERWGKKQKGVIRFLVLNFFLPWYAKWWLDYKLQREMSSVDRQAKELVNQWNEEDKPRTIMETRPSKVKGLDDISIRHRASTSWPPPDQWYKGPLEVFTQTEEGPETTTTPDTLPDPWEEKK